MEQSIIKDKLKQLDWQSVSGNMNDNGYALIKNILPTEECSKLIEQYDNPDLYRKTITIERYRFGKGEYKYFNYPLLPLIQTIRETIYPHLAIIANNWMQV